MSYYFDIDIDIDNDFDIDIDNDLNNDFDIDDVIDNNIIENDIKTKSQSQSQLQLQSKTKSKTKSQSQSQNVDVNTDLDLDLDSNTNQKPKRFNKAQQKSNTQLKKERKQKKHFANLLEEYKKYDDRFRWFDTNDFLKFINKRKNPTYYYDYAESDKYEPYDEIIEDFIADVLNIFPNANDKIILNIIVNKLKKYYTGYLYDNLTDK